MVTRIIVTRDSVYRNWSLWISSLEICLLGARSLGIWSLGIWSLGLLGIWSLGDMVTIDMVNNNIVTMICLQRIWSIGYGHQDLVTRRW
jgi:hypothetical protein